MNQKKAEMTPERMRSATLLSSRRVEGWIRVAEQVSNDVKKVERLEKHLCRACFYSARIGGAAMTNRACMSCSANQLYSSTATDQLCLACAKQHGLCKCCGGDIELNVSRNQWPEPINHGPVNTPGNPR